jgi:hypothetical protein
VGWLGISWSGLLTDGLLVGAGFFVVVDGVVGWLGISWSGLLTDGLLVGAGWDRMMRERISVIKWRIIFNASSMLRTAASSVSILVVSVATGFTSIIIGSSTVLIIGGEAVWIVFGIVLLLFLRDAVERETRIALLLDLRGVF